MPSHTRHLLALSITALIAACGGGGGDGGGSNPPVTASAPSITTAPASSTVNAGGTVTLTVVASGDGTLSYQWKRDGVDIPGATSASYTTPALTVGDSGQSYTVAVSNAAGQSTTSTAAVLTVNAAPTTVAATQEAANQLVMDVNAGVAQLSQAGLVGGLLPFGAQTLALPAGAVQSVPLAYCNTGSATMSLTTNDATGQPVSAELVFSNCNTSFGGFSSSVNGTANAAVTAWTNDTNYSLTLSYDISYSFSGAGGTETGRYVGQQTCTIANDIEDCSTAVGDNTVRDVNVRTEGTVTTVDTGRITNANLDCVYNGWVFDTSTGRATGGTVTVTAPNGDRAVLTVTSSGYSVVITVGGVSSTFNVAFAG